MSQTQRKNRANDTRVESLDQVREGVYVGDFVNERGERRENVVLIPSKIFSSSEDMLYRSAEGYVGKYLLAAAETDSEFNERLSEAIDDRIEHLESKLEQSDEQKKLREALDTTQDENLQAELVRRLQNLESDEDSVNEQAVRQAVARLEGARRYL